jgi:hypothetical protein
VVGQVAENIGSTRKQKGVPREVCPDVATGERQSIFFGVLIRVACVVVVAVVVSKQLQGDAVDFESDAIGTL